MPKSGAAFDPSFPHPALAAVLDRSRCERVSKGSGREAVSPCRSSPFTPGVRNRPRRAATRSPVPATRSGTNSSIAVSY